MQRGVAAIIPHAPRTAPPLQTSLLLLLCACVSDASGATALHSKRGTGLALVWEEGSRHRFGVLIVVRSAAVVREVRGSKVRRLDGGQEGGKKE